MVVGGSWLVGKLMKTTIILMFTGAFVGAVVASVVVPPALAWYTSPGGLPQGAQVQAVVQIPEVIRYATTSLIRGQAIGAAIGAALGLALGVSLRMRARREQTIRTSQQPTTHSQQPTTHSEQPTTHN
jgi:hypothetical protein